MILICFHRLISEFSIWFKFLHIFPETSRILTPQRKRNLKGIRHTKVPQLYCVIIKLQSRTESLTIHLPKKIGHTDTQSFHQVYLDHAVPEQLSFAVYHHLLKSKQRNKRTKISSHFNEPEFVLLHH